MAQVSTLMPEKELPTDSFIPGMKPKVNFREKTQKLGAKVKTLVANGKIEEAVTEVLEMEKQARLGGDTQSVTELCKLVLRIYQKEMDIDNIIKYLHLLCKRRSQSESVQTNIIVYGKVDILNTISKSKLGEKEKFDALVKVIEALREVSAGKLMVEKERAELTMRLAQMKEDLGDKVAACALLQEETPETYTSMPKKQKIEYLLEQFRLCLEVDDYLRANIMAKKVDKSSLDQFEESKIKFYSLLIDYYSHERNPLELAQSHLELYRCKLSKNQPKLYEPDLKAAIIYLGCSPYSNVQVDLINRILVDDKLNTAAETGNRTLRTYKAFLKRFITPEIVQWPLPEHKTVSLNAILKPGEEALKQAYQKLPPNNGGIKSLSMADDTWVYKMLFDRVIQHDIRVAAKYYSQMYLDDLAAMINLDTASTEDYISGLVTLGTGEETENPEESQYRLKTKIDRADGIVKFSLDQTPNAILTDWTGKINDLLGLVEKTCHLIHKESMLNEANNVKANN